MYIKILSRQEKQMNSVVIASLESELNRLRKENARVLKENARVLKENSRLRRQVHDVDRVRVEMESALLILVDSTEKKQVEEDKQIQEFLLGQYFSFPEPRTEFDINQRFNPLGLQTEIVQIQEK